MPTTSNTDSGQSTKQTLHSTTERVAKSAHEAIDKAADTSERLEAKAREAGHRASQQAQDFEREAVTYVRQHPYKAVGIAVAAGFVLGALLKR